MKIFSRKHGLIAFDCLLIFIQQTVCIEEIELAKIAKENNLPICLVRSKCDTDLIEPLIDRFGLAKGMEKVIQLTQDQANRLIIDRR
jgi:hypothetical protein